MDDYGFLFEKTVNHSHLFFDFKWGFDVQKNEKLTNGRERVGSINDIKLSCKYIYK